MPDREKVIDELSGMVKVCAMYGDDDAIETLNSAISMLREQEARVMTLEEARETLRTADFLVIEEPHRSNIFLGHRGERRFDLSNGEYLDFDDLDVGSEYADEYGKTFRFWTSRPSEQQMQDTKWEEESV